MRPLFAALTTNIGSYAAGKHTGATIPTGAGTAIQQSEWSIFRLEQSGVHRVSYRRPGCTKTEARRAARKRRKRHFPGRSVIRDMAGNPCPVSPQNGGA